MCIFLLALFQCAEQVGRAVEGISSFFFVSVKGNGEPVAAVGVPECFLFWFGFVYV